MNSVVAAITVRARRSLHSAMGIARRLPLLDLREAIGGIVSAYTFTRSRYPARSVLLVEPNEFHGETLPGYCAYLDELGYHVTLLVRRANLKGGAFGRVPSDKRPSIFAMGLRAMRYSLRKGPLKQFDIVFVTSTVLAEKYGYFGLFFDYLGFAPLGRDGYIVVEHNFPSLKGAIADGRIDVNRVFLLSPYRCGQRTLPMLNPHDFGRIRPHVLSEKRIFVSVGTGTTRNRDFGQLAHAIEHLDAHGYRNFEVWLIGRGLAQGVEEVPSGRLRVLGFLPFPALYAALERADFFLPLLDPDNEGHQRYLHGETTGSRQLILGFGLVPVINSIFGAAYGFSDGNALLYEGRSLADAMLRAMELTPEQYYARRRNIEGLRDAVHRESLDNLRTRLTEAAREGRARSIAPGGAS